MIKDYSLSQSLDAIIELRKMINSIASERFTTRNNELIQSLEKVKKDLKSAYLSLLYDIGNLVTKKSFTQQIKSEKVNVKIETLPIEECLNYINNAKETIDASTDSMFSIAKGAYTQKIDIIAESLLFYKDNRISLLQQANDTEKDEVRKIIIQKTLAEIG